MVEKEKQILAAALQLFVAFGFHGTPTSKIAAQAGVSNGPYSITSRPRRNLSLPCTMTPSQSGHLPVCSDQRAGRPGIQIQKSLSIPCTGRSTTRKSFTTSSNFILAPHGPGFAPGHCRAIPISPWAHHGRHSGGDAQPLPVELLFTLVSSHVYGLYQYLTAPDFPVDQRQAVIEEGYALLWRMIRK